MKAILKRFLPILLALALLVYTLRGLPLADLTSQLKQALPEWIIGAALIVTTQTLLRAIRWKMMLNSLGFRPTLGRALLATMAGNVAGLIIPGTGELIRCTLLYRSDGVPIPQSVGTAVGERIADLMAVAVILLVTLLVQTNRLVSYVSQYTSLNERYQQLSGLQLVLLIAGVVLAGLLGLWLIRLFWLALPERYKFRDKLAGLQKGVSSVFNIPNLPVFLLVNILIHGLSLVAIYVLFLALPITENLPFSAALTIVAVTSLGSITIPTQANIGSYHFLASRTLLMYAISLNNGVIWATFSHAVFTLTSLGLSLIGILPALKYLNKRQDDNQTVQSK
ncbi:flippase-like domain-containing protein [Spirosoma sp. RP8]|uniref:Flippase-like domain-containing protein n=1 Tax=Spirosoma liriopis TaxID=2937440 RepID=A0ABT0HHK5_9BACT|nr:lysylphosphatidylglycerol synthase transmembrane domain-containing protein [Spirosoma liriopis]MCK8491644.1 flippase-like domain-containing protein [Spirosoma liriopis]